MNKDDYNSLDVLTFNYIKDTTIYTILNDTGSIKMQNAMVKINSLDNSMGIIDRKSREMFISFNRDAPTGPQVTASH